MTLSKIFLTFFFFSLSFFFSSAKTYAFLGEDLGLDMYQKIDTGFQDLELKQYEYEMTGQ